MTVLKKLQSVGLCPAEKGSRSPTSCCHWVSPLRPALLCSEKGGNEILLAVQEGKGWIQRRGLDCGKGHVPQRQGLQAAILGWPGPRRLPPRSRGAWPKSSKAHAAPQTPFLLSGHSPNSRTENGATARYTWALWGWGAALEEKKVSLRTLGLW